MARVGELAKPDEIDTPERDQPFGTRAKQALSDLAYGKEARVVVIVVDVDRYGRTVGRVYVDGTDANAELVRHGYAWVYRKYAEDPKLYELEEEARKAGRGLWEHPGPIPPWEWRRGVRSSQTIQQDVRPVGWDSPTAKESTTCEAAMFYFKQCGLSRLDGDNDGIPCEALCR